MPAKAKVCAKCQVKFNNRRYLLCISCKRTLDLQCANVSEKIFNLMDLTRRASWKCDTCIKRKKKPTTSTPTCKSNQPLLCSATPKKSFNATAAPQKAKNDNTCPNLCDDLVQNPQGSIAIEEIIQEEHHLKTYKSPSGTATIPQTSTVDRTPPPIPSTTSPRIESPELIEKCKVNDREFLQMSLPAFDGSDSSLSVHDCSILAFKSLPDLSTLKNEEIDVMKNEITALKLKLQETENEMDQLILENKAKERIIEEQDRKIRDLLTICSTTPNDRVKNSSKKQKTKNRKSEIHQSFKTQSFQNTTSSVTATQPTSKPNKLMNDSLTEQLTQENIITTHTNAKVTKKRIFVLADQQGKGLQQALQSLMGEEYEVVCFWKSGANLEEILSTCQGELCGLTAEDFIVIVGGMNDCDPSDLRIKLLKWLNSNRHSNLVICGLPCDAALNCSLNREIQLICDGFIHSVFVRMNYSRAIFGSKYFVSNLSFAIFREITHVSYRMHDHLQLNKAQYQNSNQISHSKTVNTEIPTTRPTDNIASSVSHNNLQHNQSQSFL